MKAIIETGGKQYNVAVGDVIYVEKLDVEEGKKVTFDIKTLSKVTFLPSSTSNFST